MSPFEFVVRVAAAWRITRLIVEDEITRELRDAVRDRFGEDHKLTYLVNCPYCVSVWAGLACMFLPRAVTGSLALSAGTLGIKWVAEVTEAGVMSKGSSR
jgi:hypothetical protein